MEYFVQADVKLESATAEAGLCLRVARDQNASAEDAGDRFYELRLNGPDGLLEFGYREYHLAQGWLWWQLDFTSVPNPHIQWHSIAIETDGDTFYCYRLNENPTVPCMTVPDVPRYIDGLVGLWVESNVALFDNVKVLDLR
jgi:hypothetical protein